jgi:hypothetical protein
MEISKHIPNMTTMKIPHSSDVSALLPFRKEQSKIYRLSYKLASYGLPEIQIRHDLKEKSINYDLTDSWLMQSAIKRALGQFKSEMKLDEKNGTNNAGKRIFGGKENFFRRLKRRISKEEYQSNRIENFRSIGEAPQSGNRKVVLDYDKIIVKPKSGVRIEITIPSLRGVYAKDYNKLVKMTKNKELAITVEINEKFVYISFDKALLDKKADIKPLIKGRYLGIDLNPNYIGVSIFNEDTQLLDARLFSFTSLTGKKCNSDKLKHEIREVAIQIGRIAQHYQIEYLFLEDLSFKQGDKGLGKRYNRLVINQFLYTEFGRMLSKFGRVVTVNAAYSSTIGNILYNEYPDPIASSMEIARRGIESRTTRDSDKFYPTLPTKNRLLNQWKEAAGVEFDGWIQVHRWLKSTGMRYRVPIPSIEMFRTFVSKHSSVLVLNC